MFEMQFNSKIECHRIWKYVSEFVKDSSKFYIHASTSTWSVFRRNDPSFEMVFVTKRVETGLKDTPVILIEMSKWLWYPLLKNTELGQNSKMIVISLI